MRLRLVKYGDRVVVRWTGYGQFVGHVYMIDTLLRRIGVMTPTGTGIAVPARAVLRHARRRR